MSLNVNHVILAGNLTRDPELRTLAGDRAVANFAIAINRRYKSPEGEAKEDVTFVEVEAWGRTAEVVGQYLAKGSPCYLEGRLKLDAWQDKDGQKRSRLKLVAESVQFLSRGQRPGEAGTAEGQDGEVATIAPPAGRPAPGGRPRVAAAPQSGTGAATGVLDEPPF
jgi:single-strand DNA-binding protein